jgi:hypothetical protein
MVFIESPIFTADVVELLGDEEYAELQEIGRVLKTGASSNPYRKLREGKTDP